LLIEHRGELKRSLVHAAIGLVSFACFLVLFYPASWGGPVRFFVQAAAFMSHHPWNGNMLFMGKIYGAHDLPWYYLPVWIFITTPIPLLVFFLLGLVFGGIRFATKGASRLGPMSRTLWLVATLLFVGPLLLAFLVKPTIYDGWRHFYFLYAPLLLLAVNGVAECWFFLSRAWKPAALLRLALSALVLAGVFAPVCVWMVMNHPYQYVYFSPAVRAHAYGSFEKDYWGVSEIKGLAYIMRTDQRATIKVFNGGETVQISEMLPEKDRLRIIWADKPEDADYRLTTFRETTFEGPPANEVYHIEVDGHRIMSVVKKG
jgi:hypothetical protein